MPLYGGQARNRTEAGDIDDPCEDDGADQAGQREAQRQRRP